MYLWLTIGGIAFLFLSTSMGAALVFCFKNTISRKTNAVFLGFTSGIMVAASVWSMILPALKEAENGWGRYAFTPISIGILIGAVFLYFADKLSKTLQKNKKKNRQGGQLQNPFKLFLAITLHNIPEGLAVGFAFGVAWAVQAEQHFVAALGLAFGIGIQNLPEGAAIALPMCAALKSRRKAFYYGALSGVFEVVFAVLGCVSAAYLRFLQPWLLAFSAGTMFFVVAQDLLPSANSVAIKDGNVGFETDYAHAAWGFIVGFILMLILDVALG